MKLNPKRGQLPMGAKKIYPLQSTETKEISNQSGQTCKAGHRSINEKCDHCRQLISFWSDKLEDSGFIDIEKKKDWRTGFNFTLTEETKSTSQSIFDAKFTYFSWAEEKLTLNKFPSEKDKYIWECHTEGLSTREIIPRVGYKQSWIAKRIIYMRRLFKEHSSGSGSQQLDLFFWGAPHEFIKMAL